MTGPCLVRSVLRALPWALLLCLAGLALPASALAADEVTELENMAGARDTLTLVDLGNGACAINTMIASEGDLTREQSWVGALRFSRAKFAVGDVNADGLADGVVLYDMGRKRARFYVFLSDGTTLQKRVAWTSPKGAYSWSRAKLAVGDLNSDGRDDVTVLYDRGRGRAELQRFISRGRTFTLSVGWRGRLSWAKAQLAAGDVNADGAADAVVLSQGTASSLLTFRSVPPHDGRPAKFTKKTSWTGAYTAGARLAVGDVDSDGDCDAVCLRDNGDGRVALDVFLSDTATFAAPATWWLSGAGEIDAPSARLACGDVNADGAADAVLLTAPAGGGSLVTVVGSTRTAFQTGMWWSGGSEAAKTRLACAPATPFILRDTTTVLSDAALAALQTVSPDGAVYTFTSGLPEVDGLAAGDVIVFQPCDPLPYGAIRKVTTVATGGGVTVVTTGQAQLEEAVGQGELAAVDTYSQNDIAAVVSEEPGVRLVQQETPRPRAHGLRKRASVGISVSVEFDVTYGNANLEGSLGFDQRFSLNSDFGVVRWKWGFIPIFGMQYVQFASTTTQTTHLGATLSGSLEKEIEKDIATYRLRTVLVWFGPVPVTFTPEVTLYVGASGKVTAGIHTEVTTVTTATAGVEWRRGAGWKTFSGFSNTTDFVKPQLFANMELKAWVGLKAMLKIYELGGPTVKLQAYGELLADIRAEHWWRLYVGLEANPGFEIGVLDLEWYPAEPLELFRFLVVQAPGRHVPMGVANGTILSASTGVPLPGATVRLHRGADSPTGTLVASAVTGANGRYGFPDITPGDYTVVASKTPYLPANRTIAVPEGAATTDQDLQLGLPSTPGISGTIKQTGLPVNGATVELRGGWDDTAGELLDTVTTGPTGTYLFTDLEPGDYTVLADATDFCPRHISVGLGSSFVVDQDVELIHDSLQGVYGIVRDGIWGPAVEGATVTVHEGFHAPDGPVVATTTSDESGVYGFSGLAADPARDYTLTATAPGYVRAIRELTVHDHEVVAYHDLCVAATDGASPAKAPGIVEYIGWPGVGLDNANATYELLFKPQASAGGRIAAITWWYDYPTPRYERVATMYLDYTGDGKVAFGIKESHGATEGVGTWHVITSTSTLALDSWYHIAAQNGSSGMRLYVDGQLEASDPYTGGPQTDWAGCKPTDGWFSLGDIVDVGGENTEAGGYAGLRVSKVQRHFWDFAPPMPGGMTWDDATDILDPLEGGTNGWNHGFVWEP